MPMQVLPSEQNAKIFEIRAFVTPLLHFIPRSIPDYTDHGITHSMNLEGLLSNFIKNSKELLTTEELFIIKASIWLHDIGCLICEQDNKDNHGKFSVQLIDSEHCSFIKNIINKDLLTCIKYVILSHQSNYDFKKLPKNKIHHNVNLMLVCAIFRLLDACDISASRVNFALYKILKEKRKLGKEHLPYWEAHRSIISVVFNKENIDIMVDDEETSNLYTSHLNEDLKAINEIFNKYPGWNGYKINKMLMELDWKNDM